MSRTTQPQTIHYVAEINHVQEVTLVGAADGDYWKSHLACESLFPYLVHGGAQVILSATALRWMGIRFHELIFAVAVSDREDGSSRDGVFLFAAINTSRMLAFCERTFFRTPYQFGHVILSSESPFAFRLLDQQEIVLGAERLDTAPPAETMDDNWEWPIYLPKRGERFFARLTGKTEVYPWASGRDVLKLKSASRESPIRVLVDSRFVGVEWRVRRSAYHARSKTFPRTD